MIFFLDQLSRIVSVKKSFFTYFFRYSGFWRNVGDESIWEPERGRE